MVFFSRTDAGPPAGGISNPHPHPQYAGAGAGPPMGEISNPHSHPSSLKSADTRIRGWNCHPYPLHCQALRSKAAGQEAIAGAAMASRAAGVVIKAEPERRGEEVGAGVTKTERGFGVSWSK